MQSGKQETEGEGHLNLRENVVVVTIQTQMQGVAFVVVLMLKNILIKPSGNK